MENLSSAMAKWLRLEKDPNKIMTSLDHLKPIYDSIETFIDIFKLDPTKTTGKCIDELIEQLPNDLFMYYEKSGITFDDMDMSETNKHDAICFAQMALVNLADFIRLEL